jgi:hypothetical protein
MTPSDKAWSVINELRETWCNAPCNYQEGCGCSDAIAAAIRQAELAAYERAAQVADAEMQRCDFVLAEVAPNMGPSVRDTYEPRRTCAKVIGEAIRALKEGE